MAEKLTPQQQQAVEDQGGRLLVSAAAGSGKTKVLVDRLLRYLTDPQDPANIDDFLIITFTKAAAAELRAKISAKLSERVAQSPNDRHLQQQLQRLYLTQISTVHGFCSDVLRQHAYRLDLPGDFRVADENECKEIRQNVMQSVLDHAYDRLEQDPDVRCFIDTQGLGRGDQQIPEILETVYDSARCHLDPKQWLDRCRQMVETEDLTDAAQTVYGGYLLQRMYNWLDLQIPVIQRCVALAAAADGGQNVSALFASIGSQLQLLRDSDGWDQAVQRSKIDFGRLSFTKKFDAELKDQLKSVLAACKSYHEKYTKALKNLSKQVLTDLAASADAIRGLITMVETFDREFEKAKRGRRVLDFGDLEHKMLDLLLGKSRSGYTALAAELGSRYREIMVDEYQDSNAVQDAMYEALTREKQNLFMVGDVKQSIYQFRQADPSIFLKKYSSYTPAEQAQPGQGRKVVLSKNFRSGGGVLDGCNDVFEMCMRPDVGGLHYGGDERLYEGFDHAPLPEPEVSLHFVDVQKKDYAEEGAFVAKQIRQLLDGEHFVREGDQLRPVRAEDIAILLRSSKGVVEHFRRALDQQGIRYVSGGGEDLLQTREIITLRAILQVIHNPRLDIPLITAMSSPVFAFTADDLAAIRAGNKDCAFYDAVQQHESPKTKAFLDTLLRLRATMRYHNLTGLLGQILLQTNMEGIFSAMDEGQFRLANIHSFYQVVSDFEAGGHGDLGRFLEYLEAMDQKGLICEAEQKKEGCVTIMTIHKSKGLEFPIVFLSALGKPFSNQDQIGKVLCHKEIGLGLNAVDPVYRLRYPTIAKQAIAAQKTADNLSEEMRVLYVGMTRARDRLIMTYACKNLEKRVSEMTQRLNVEGRELLVRGARCFGDWILLTALHRTEAGALFCLGGKPLETKPGKTVWHITVENAPVPEGSSGEAEVRPELPPQTVEILRQGLAFQYAHTSATMAPSKQTATQRKGRDKDAEAAENAHAPKQMIRQWRRPEFIEQQVHGKEYGSAIHAAMQYIDYAACADEASVQRELQRLVEQRYISSEQGSMIHPQKIFAFFKTPLGQKLRQGSRVIREFKFSILEDADAYDPDLAGEQVLLQGVVDCALIEEDGITVIDFKTDYVNKDTLPLMTERYRPQVEAYAQALARIYGLPIKTSLLYFFHLDTFQEI